MTPTPEQVAAWAREAGIWPERFAIVPPMETFRKGLEQFATLAFTEGCALQAEQDAKVCEQVRIETFMTESHIRQVAQARETIFAAIRANAPKATP